MAKKRRKLWWKALVEKRKKVVAEYKKDILEKQLRKLVTELIPEANYEKIRKEEVEKVNQRALNNHS